jgi:hypothetical protein
MLEDVYVCKHALDCRSKPSAQQQHKARATTHIVDDASEGPLTIRAEAVAYMSVGGSGN